MLNNRPDDTISHTDDRSLVSSCMVSYNSVSGPRKSSVLHPSSGRYESFRMDSGLRRLGIEDNGSTRRPADGKASRTRVSRSQKVDYTHLDTRKCLSTPPWLLCHLRRCAPACSASLSLCHGREYLFVSDHNSNAQELAPRTIHMDPRDMALSSDAPHMP
jgi:hypothetical protein